MAYCLTVLCLTIQMYCTPITYDDFFSALHNVETPLGYPLTNPAHKGSYQISEAYWQDTGLPGTWADVENDRYAELTMLKYWERYAPLALVGRDYQTLARLHNGGPDGPYQPETELYWRLIKRELSTIAAKRIYGAIPECDDPGQELAKSPVERPTVALRGIY